MTNVNVTKSYGPEVHTVTVAEHQRNVAAGFLRRAIEILEAKGHDYASDADAFSNFRFTGLVLDFAVTHGLRGPHLAFLALIATKLARAIELLGAGKVPENETLADTLGHDIPNYSALWTAYTIVEDANESED